MGSLLSAVRRMLFAEETGVLEVALIGLENSGKTTLVNFICTGEKPAIATHPTIGVNVKVAKKKQVTIKMWDMTGQERGRQDWLRYCADQHCIIFCVDSISDRNRVATAKDELFRLVSSSAQFAATPLMICLTKTDVTPHLSEEDAVELLSKSSSL